MSPEKRQLVEGYMQTEVATIAPGASFREVVSRMQETETNSLFVVDGERRVVGVVSNVDVLRYIVPDYLEEDKHLAPFEAAGIFDARVREIAEHPVERFMTATVHTIHPDHTLMEAAALLTEHGINQLPVVDADNRLVGYIGRTNIKHAIQDLLGTP